MTMDTVHGIEDSNEDKKNPEEYIFRVSVSGNRT